MLYFDAAYLVRLHTRDAGWEKVRALAATDHVGCSLHGQAESVAAFHRKFREGAITQKEFGLLVAEFQKDGEAGAFTWFPLSPSVVSRAVAAYANLPSAIPLRASDALHLACAAENGFREIHSNDARLLAGAPHFGLRGANVI